MISSSKDPADKQSVKAVKEAALERFVRDIDALFPPTPTPTPGESSIDQPKEERKEKAFARLAEFMKRGACKESTTALFDCFEETDGSTDCVKYMPKLIKCVEAHSDYYQPIITLAESNVLQTVKDLVILEAEEAAAKKPAKGWLSKFW